MSKNKTAILDNFHRVINNVNYADQLYHNGRLHGAIISLKIARDNIAKLIKEIGDD